MTRDELATWIVRTAERYPDRVDEWGCWKSYEGSRCLLSQAYVDHGGDEAICKSDVFLATLTDWATGDLARRAIGANDKRIRWGDIPVLLGLVPGEQPAEETMEPVQEPAESTLTGAR